MSDVQLLCRVEKAGKGVIPKHKDKKKKCPECLQIYNFYEAHRRAEVTA